MPYPFIKNYQKPVKIEDKNAEDEQRKKHNHNSSKKKIVQIIIQDLNVRVL